MRFVTGILRAAPCALLAAAICWGSPARAGVTSRSPRFVVQPLEHYSFPLPADARTDEEWFFPTRPHYDHVGGDYGLMGPGRDKLRWRPGRVDVDLSAGGWAGVWHSLAGPVRDHREWLDFTRCYPDCVTPGFQPRCVGLSLRVGGYGRLKLEIATPDGAIPWRRTVELSAADPDRTLSFDVDPEHVRRAKQFNWVAESGSVLHIGPVDLILEYPDVPFETRVFLTSFAKLARCADVPPGSGPFGSGPSGSGPSGLVRDKAHLPPGAFDSIPASGMFCLASCAARVEGIVDREFAERTLRRTHAVVRGLPRRYGLLPHFARVEDGHFRPHPATEYSTVDTSLYYHSMLLAARILDDEVVLAELTRDVSSVDIDKLTDPDGRITHGVGRDGRVLVPVWQDWGGETALVVLMARMAGREKLPKTRRDGAVAGGVGFIGEIQSLFYREFNSPGPDATGVNWLRARRDLLARQSGYFPGSFPGCRAAADGIFGLSAGEGTDGYGYVANGVDTRGLGLIHPHYMVMSGMTRPRPADTFHFLRRAEALGLMPPWGLVENVTPDLARPLPMLGSLNAAFEALASYHLLADAVGQPDLIYDAVPRTPPLRSAIAVYYPRPEISSK